MKRILFVLLTYIAFLLSACAQAAPAAVATEAVGTEAVLKVSGGSTEKNYTSGQLEVVGAAQADFKGVTYVGVTLSALLKDAGFDPGKVAAVKAVASDGFTVNYEPALFNKEDTLLAYATRDGSLSAEDGAFRMVLPAEGGKLNPRQLTEIQVIQ